MTVLAYHGIDHPERFAWHLDYLRKNSAPISLADLHAALDGSGGLPHRAVLITFDDGDPSLVKSALPLLIERRLPAAAFVVAGLVNRDEAPWWQTVEAAAGPEMAAGMIRALKEMPDIQRRQQVDLLSRQAPTVIPQLRTEDLHLMMSAGVAIGNHSLTHPCLPRCEDHTVNEEIAGAHRRLTELLGSPPESFAYPNGDWDVRAEGRLRELGYRSGFLFDHRPATIPVPNSLQISRVRVNSTTRPDRFALIMSGLHPALHRVRGGQ